MSKAQLSVRISEVVKQHVARYVTTSGVTMDQLVEQALFEYLQNLRDVPPIEGHDLAG
jgi:hypothetical protein